MGSADMEIVTISEIAEMLGVGRHRVAYIVDRRRIAPAGRAGIARLYKASDIHRIAGELKRVQQDRGGADAR